jgi:hypothetical protein
MADSKLLKAVQSSNQEKVEREARKPEASQQAQKLQPAPSVAAD